MGNKLLDLIICAPNISVSGQVEKVSVIKSWLARQNEARFIKSASCIYRRSQHLVPGWSVTGGCIARNWYRSGILSKLQ